jgi:hypothetical protein
MPRDRISDEALARLMAAVLSRRRERAVLTGATGPAGGVGDPPFVNPMTAQGDLIRGGESGAPVRLPIGASGQVLTVSSGLPAWQNPPASYPGDEAIQDMIAAFLQAGANISLTYNDAANTLTIAVTGLTSYPGDEAIQDMIASFLVAGTGISLTYNDAANTLTIEATSSGGMTNPMTTAGDIIVGGSGGTPQRLGIGSNGQVLTVVSGAPSWATPSGGGGGSISAGPIGSRPSAGTAGRLYFCTDTPLICYDDGSAWRCWGSQDYPIAEPNNAAFSWAAQGFLGNASLDTSKGGIILRTPRTAADSWAIRVVSMPTPPFTLTARLRPLLIGRSTQEAGIIARNSSSGAFVSVEVLASQSAQRVRMAKWNSPTSFSAEYDSGVTPWPIERPLWLRWVDNGTNRAGYFSYDGIYWHQVPSDTVARTDFTTPDQIGFGVNGNNNNVGTDPAVWLLGWEIT